MDHIKLPTSARPELTIGEVMAGFEAKHHDRPEIALIRFLNDYLMKNKLPASVQEVVLSKQNVLTIKAPTLVKSFLKLKEPQIMKLLKGSFSDQKIKQLR